MDLFIGGTKGMSIDVQYKQLQKASPCVLPAINRTQTFFFIDCSHYLVAFYNVRNQSVIRPENIAVSKMLEQISGVPRTIRGKRVHQYMPAVSRGEQHTDLNP
jgi:hypothetical protein